MTVKQRKKQMVGRAVLGAVIVFVASGITITANRHKDKDNSSEMIEATEDVNRFDPEDVEVEGPITIQPNPTLPNIRFYDVPLSKELQLFVFMECDAYSFWPNIAIALMDVESDFIVDAVSPNGAIGVMQVAPQWHPERMELLGCDNLYDPYQNIRVGMHYLAELWNEKQDLCWVLMAYRHGRGTATELLNRGIVDEYALEVLRRAAELQLEMEERYGSN